MKCFKMIRKHDTSGVSGTGHVLTGIIFDDGQVIVKWYSQTSSIGVWQNFDDFMSVHVTSHPENETEIIWLKIENV